jgi:hypothetical protein
MSTKSSQTELETEAIRLSKMALKIVQIEAAARAAREAVARAALERRHSFISPRQIPVRVTAANRANPTKHPVVGTMSTPSSSPTRTGGTKKQPTKPKKPIKLTLKKLSLY